MDRLVTAPYKGTVERFLEEFNLFDKLEIDQHFSKNAGGLRPSEVRSGHWTVTSKQGKRHFKNEL
jgi:hypothetical protein